VRLIGPERSRGQFLAVENGVGNADNEERQAVDNRNSASPLNVIAPAGIAPPFSRYAHGIAVKPNCRWLHISGQVGIHPDGKMAEGAAAQLEQAFANLFSVLVAAGMGKQDLVKLTVFLTHPDQVGFYRTVRDRCLDGAVIASTILIVAGLASPDFLVEVEAVAAAPVP
jgi:enamine deaminase RidA (YjgF/YER057c/UK114 family)